MDGAANPAAAPEADLENGGGGAVEAWAYPADKQLKEKQPFTWLGAAPYVAAVLAGAALLAAGAVVYYSRGPATNGQGQEGSQQPYHMATMDLVGLALMWAGTMLALLGIFAGVNAADEGRYECNLPRFGPD